jgi:hypothetical protein
MLFVPDDITYGIFGIEVLMMGKHASTFKENVAEAVVVAKPVIAPAVFNGYVPNLPLFTL